MLLSWKTDTNNINNKKKNVAVLFSCFHHVEAVEEAVVLIVMQLAFFSCQAMKQKDTDDDHRGFQRGCDFDCNRSGGQQEKVVADAESIRSSLKAAIRFS